MSELLSSFPTLYCGHQYTICIDEDNNLWSFGRNNLGQCGQCFNNTSDIIFPPKQIDNLYDIKFIACGYSHTICCDFNGKIFSFGVNTQGQLGLNNYELRYSNVPQQVNLPPIKQISCGSYSSICLSVDGDLWSFGQNFNGQLGLESKNVILKPTAISDLPSVEYIICGGFFSICKISDNEYYSWGENNYGQLALNHFERGDKFFIPQKCNNIPNNIISIKAGIGHVLFLSSNGIVYSCGDNTLGQLGHGNNTNLCIPKEISLPFIIKISCGNYYSLCIDYNNSLWVFGANGCGQLGLGHTDDINKPIKHEILKNVADLSYRSDSALIKTLDNKIFSFGFNSHSQLGIQTDNSLKDPIQIFNDKEDIWKIYIPKSKVKSANKIV